MGGRLKDKLSSVIKSKTLEANSRHDQLTHTHTDHSDTSLYTHSNPGARLSEGITLSNHPWELLVFLHYTVFTLLTVKADLTSCSYNVPLNI